MHGNRFVEVRRVNTADQVDKIITQMKMAGMPLSDAAWQTALACVGWPYVFGAWGEYCTPANRKRRYREDHQTIKSSCQVLNGKKTSCDGCKWFPDGCRVRMFDCRGFTDWVLKQFGIDLQGEGATSQWNNDANWTAKGTIDTIPDDVLVCLFVKSGSKMQHTGFGYKGASCECSSGVQYFAKRKAKWTNWALPKGIDGYMPDTRPTIKRGSTGPAVVECQDDLIRLGYDLGNTGADGKFGPKTEAAVKSFQSTHKDSAGRPLTVDGVVGPATWSALDQAVADLDPTPEPETLYTVTIPHVTKEQAESLVNTYAGATMTEERGE